MDKNNQQRFGHKVFPHLKLWVSQYGSSGSDDQRAVQVFMDCETRESHATLRSEIMTIASGNYDSKSLDIMLGKGRATKYSNYEGWAKYMLQWMAGYKA